jgi:hypothetical protein
VYRKVLFLAPPSKAIEAFAAAPARAGQPDGALMGGNGFIENECLRVTARGALIELLDKRTGQRWPNLNLLEEEADAGDAWDFAPPWTPGALIRSTAGTFQSRLTEMGGVRATLRIEGELLVPERLVGDERSRENVKMRVAFDVSLYRSLPRADVKMTLVNTARDHRIRLRVPTASVPRPSSPRAIWPSWSGRCSASGRSSPGSSRPRRSCPAASGSPRAMGRRAWRWR